MEPEYIVVEGANTHNLKNVSLRVPRGKLVVMTGVSGSGKSSLAFDTIFAEGQRRYMESLSSYAKQVVGQLEKPDVLYIEGLSPAISIDQRTIGRNPRSTVGTITEIADYLRILYAAIGSTEGSARQPREFSPNSPYGACSACSGIGSKTDIDPGKLIAADRSLKQGAILLWAGTSGWEVPMLKALAELTGIEYDRPLIEQDGRLLDMLLYGYDQAPVAYTHRGEERSHYYQGVVNILRYMRDHGTTSKGILAAIERFSGPVPCPECGGQRLKKESLGVRLLDRNIAEVMAMSVTEMKSLYSGLSSSLVGLQRRIVQHVEGEIVSRLSFLESVGLGYLTLDRTADTLSGGEAQRIRLASQLGSKLCGVLYVLDEPSIGLHPRDNAKLIDTLHRLRDNGNTVLVVEHDEDTMRAADWIVDLGPGAGRHGGEITVEGTLDDIMHNDHSLTGAYLSGRKRIALPNVRRKAGDKRLVIRGAREHNLRNIDVAIPIGLLTCVTGVSGSGKSTLINDILYRSLAIKLSQATELPGLHDAIDGIQHVKKVIRIDQSPIGRTPTSNPATYTGAYELIRDLLADTPVAKKMGYTKSHFSFNVAGKNAGRCEACKGDGFVIINMHFMPDVYVPCAECGGARFKKETLDIAYNGKHIADILNMSAGEAAEFFSDVPKLHTIMQTLVEVGLDYVKLGQPASELSGGEAQRVKLAAELSRPSKGNTVYILDEPTIGDYGFSKKFGWIVDRFGVSWQLNLP